MSRILVVDDEPRVTSFVSRALSHEGFVVDEAYDGVRALRLAETGAYDLIVLDLLLPALDGVSLLRRLFETRPDQAVVVLSGVSDARARVRCLEIGVSDYITKPFDLSELLLRVKAHLRRSPAPPVDRILSAGRVRLDLRRMTADSGDGPVRLTPREFHLLQHLMSRPGRVCGREELLSAVWSFSFSPQTNVVDVYVRRLRSKLGNHVIETVRNVGYSFRTV